MPSRIYAHPFPTLYGSTSLLNLTDTSMLRRSGSWIRSGQAQTAMISVIRPRRFVPGAEIPRNRRRRRAFRKRYTGREMLLKVLGK